MLSVCGSGSLWSLALGLVRQLHRSHLQLNGIGELQMTRCLRGQWRMALSWEASAWKLALMRIGDVEKKGLEVDRVDLNGSLSACEKGSAWSFVMDRYGRLRTAGACSHETISACLSIVFNAAVDALGQRWPFAVQLLSTAADARVAVEMFFYGFSGMRGDLGAAADPSSDEDDWEEGEEGEEEEETHDTAVDVATEVAASSGKVRHNETERLKELKQKAADTAHSLSPPVSGRPTAPSATASDVADTLPMDVTALPVPESPAAPVSPGIPTSSKRESYQVKKAVRSEGTMEMGNGDGETKEKPEKKKATPPAKEEVPEEYIKRKDQLEIKPERGRSTRRGRGRGNGRGRGETGRGRGGRGPKAAGKQKSAQSQEDWWDWTDEWGYPSQDFEDSSSYWDSYAWWAGKEALETLGGDQGEAANSHSEKNKKKPEKAPKTAKDVPHKKRKVSKDDETDLNETGLSKTSKKKRKNVEEPKQEEHETPASREPKGKKTTKKREDTTEPPSETLPSMASLPTHKGLKKAIRKYYNQFKTDTSTVATEDIKQHMKSQLPNLSGLNECRLNSYWRLGTCGVTSKSKKRDIAHFSFPDQDLSYMAGLALCLKCAEQFVTSALAVDIALTNGHISDAELVKDGEWCTKFSNLLKTLARDVLSESS
eukprot:s1704_g8.t1